MLKKIKLLKKMNLPLFFQDFKKNERNFVKN